MAKDTIKSKPVSRPQNIGTLVESLVDDVSLVQQKAEYIIAVGQSYGDEVPEISTIVEWANRVLNGVTTLRKIPLTIDPATVSDAVYRALERRRKRVVKEYGRLRMCDMEFETTNCTMPSNDEYIKIFQNIIYSLLNNVKFGVDPDRYEDKNVVGCTEEGMPVMIADGFMYQRDIPSHIIWSFRVYWSSENVAFHAKYVEQIIRKMLDDISRILNKDVCTVIKSDIQRVKTIGFDNPNDYAKIMNILYSVFPCTSTINWRPTILMPDDLMAL